MVAPPVTNGWLLYPPKGKLTETAQRVVCWSNHDKRIQIGTAGGTHFVIPYGVCDGTALSLTPGAAAGDQIVCKDAVTPDGWVVVAGYDADDVLGINPNTCTQTAAPGSLAASGTPTATSITATWNAVPGATRYLLRWRKKTPTGAWTDVWTSSPPVTVGGLTAGTAYEFQVQAEVGGILGTPTALVTITTAAS